jgi:hypothetical protein
MMRKSLPMFWQSWILIVVGVLFYLVDCLVAHKAHPDVSWIESGVYNWGPFGFLASVGAVVAGIYCLLFKKS